MGRLLLLIRGIAPFLYFFAGVGVLLGLRSLWRAWGELSVAQFRLEREQAEEQGGWAITQTVVLVEVIILVFVLTTITYDAWNDFTTAGEPTPSQGEAYKTAVPAQVGEGFQQPTAVGGGPVLVRTQPPSPTPAGTLLPADAPLGCLADQANIETPDNGQIVFQTQPIIGTATIQNFGYYRFEIRNMENGGGFGVIGGAESDYVTPVQNGPLGQIVPQNFAPGEYRFRMTVFDTGGVMRAACEITVFISEPLPTPTPIGGGVPVPAGDGN